ncbi:hypothetical protein Bca101_050121 [Brassica carinata]
MEVYVFKPGQFDQNATYQKVYGFHTGALYTKHIKQWKRDSDRRELVLHAHHCIPKTCVCGAPIRLSTDEKGKSYFECTEFEDDGFHIHHGCFNAFEEELEELNEKVA